MLDNGIATDLLGDVETVGRDAAITRALRAVEKGDRAVEETGSQLSSSSWITT
jgi:hypothetical protein